jgi:hypothetical protein
MIWAAVQVAKPGYVVTSGKTVGLFTGEFKGHIFSLFFIFWKCDLIPPRSVNNPRHVKLPQHALPGAFHLRDGLHQPRHDGHYHHRPARYDAQERDAPHWVRIWERGGC